MPDAPFTGAASRYRVNMANSWIRRMVVLNEQVYVGVLVKPRNCI